MFDFLQYFLLDDDVLKSLKNEQELIDYTKINLKFDDIKILSDDEEEVVFKINGNINLFELDNFIKLLNYFYNNILFEGSKSYNIDPYFNINKDNTIKLLCSITNY